MPVLSSTKVVARPSVSSAPPPRTRTPIRDARDSPDTIATGAARSKGQGVATTRTATARVAEPLSSHAAPETASASGTNQAAALSARRITGADSAAASRASRTIPAYVESAAVALARISSPPPALTLPLRTFSPQSWRTCTDSPVSADSSMIANSETTRPSTGSTSPEPTTSTSSTTIDSRVMTSKS